MPVLPYETVVKVFGDPTQHTDVSGEPTPAWMQRMTAISLPAPIPYIVKPGVLKSIRCHKKIAVYMAEAFDILHRNNQWHLLKDCGGGFCWRLSRKSTAISRHSWGIAVDLNVAENPFMKPPKMDARIVRAFESQGFIWGGDWRIRKDGMHFEFYDVDRLSQEG